MTQNNTDRTDSAPETAAPHSLRKERRPSRYAAAQARRDAAKAKDNRFYAAIFSLVTVVVLFAILISALMLYGANIDASGMGEWAAPWVLGLSKMEVAGLGVVALIGFGMWRKIKK